MFSVLHANAVFKVLKWILSNRLITSENNPQMDNHQVPRDISAGPYLIYLRVVIFLFTLVPSSGTSCICFISDTLAFVYNFITSCYVVFTAGHVPGLGKGKDGLKAPKRWPPKRHYASRTKEKQGQEEEGQ